MEKYDEMMIRNFFDEITFQEIYAKPADWDESQRGPTPADEVESVIFNEEHPPLKQDVFASVIDMIKSSKKSIKII